MRDPEEHPLEMLISAVMLLIMVGGGLRLLVPSMPVAIVVALGIVIVGLWYLVAFRVSRRS